MKEKTTNIGIHELCRAHYNWSKVDDPAAADTCMGKRAVSPKQALPSLQSGRGLRRLTSPRLDV
jgi:hypothetical protein